MYKNLARFHVKYIYMNNITHVEILISTQIYFSLIDDIIRISYFYTIFKGCVLLFILKAIFI